ncbi:MAG: carboxypeptidase-like regulatory domain-containing protein [Kofleriaceae bacterium]|nr:carboxypeptidase-like regulatory domain-containing protein [Kofleriaceae bacterium]
MRSLRRMAFTCVATLAIATATVHGQPAGAIGHPLPESSLAVGTVTVRVVDGTPSKPVVGTDVTLLVNGQPRQARTDAAGRATFSDLPPGASVQAKIIDADKKEQASETFPVPAQGGTRLMLSVSPFQGMGGAPPMAGGGMGMPSGRQMSGQPRPDRGDPPGMYVARLTYDNLSMNNGQITDTAPPVGTPVFLVGYAANDSVKIYTTPVDKDGLAIFPDLDMTGATAYYALAALPRTGTVDRLIAVGTILDGKTGQRVVLSGEKRESTAPGVDDYDKLIPRGGPVVPAGQVRVSLDGVAPPDSPISLIDARTGVKLGTQAAKPGAADSTQVVGGAEFDAAPDLPNGTLEVVIKGGQGKAQDPMPGIVIKLIDDKDQEIPGAVASTGADGIARLMVPAGTQARAVLTINTKPMVSQPIDLSSGGGARMSVTANWPDAGDPEAVFTVTPEPGQVLYAEATMAGQKFRSLPFLNLPEAGMHVNVYVFPRTLFRFDSHSYVEDQLLAFQGEMQVTNYSWAPYKAGDDGLTIKLPAGFKGAIVGPQDADEVAVTEHVGFRILRPIPPGGRTFRMGYSMPIVDGRVKWSFPLPMGTFKSEMKIRQTPGMTVKLPDGIRGETQRATTGEPWFVITDIMLDREKSLDIELAGFPAPPSWKKWAKNSAGVLVLLTVLGGIAFAFMRKRDPQAERQTRRAQLLDELVELERKGEGGKRKEQLLAELEQLWMK